MDQKTQRSHAFPPTFCHGVACIFLTAPLSYDAVAIHRGQCEQLLRYVKLATSSIHPSPVSVIVLTDTSTPHGCDASRLSVGPLSGGAVRVVTFPYFSVGYR